MPVRSPYCPISSTICGREWSSEGTVSFACRRGPSNWVECWYNAPKHSWLAIREPRTSCDVSLLSNLPPCVKTASRCGAAHFVRNSPTKNGGWSVSLLAIPIGCSPLQLQRLASPMPRSPTKRSSSAGTSLRNGSPPSAWAATPEATKADALLMGAALAQARSWLAKRPEDLPEPDREFIVKSLRAAQ